MNWLSKLRINRSVIVVQKARNINDGLSGRLLERLSRPEIALAFDALFSDEHNHRGTYQLLRLQIFLAPQGVS